MSRVLPILFNTDMVRAILDDRKTATRRVIKHPPHPDMPDNHNYCKMPLWMRIGKNEYGFRTLHYMDVIEQNPFKQTRYFESLAPYEKGDILYVRETWCNLNTLSCPCYYYKASDNLPEWAFGGWNPSIHMPKEAARIWIKVKDVRVERLHDITEEQAEAEGLYKGWRLTKTSSFASTAKQAFMWVWDMTINAKQFFLYGWPANPWVWVIEFERCEKPAEG